MIRQLSDGKAFFIVTLMLVLFGLVMVLSASAVKGFDEAGSGYYYVGRQALYAGFGFVVMAAFARANYRSLRPLSPVIVVVAAVLLVAVLIPGIGEVVNGARRWIDVGLFRFQPSETAKLAVILFSATYLAAIKEQLTTMKSIVPPLVVAGLLGLLVFLEPDMGTAGIIVIGVLMLLFLAGARLRHLFALTTVIGGATVLAVLSESYRAARLTAFLDPWRDPQGNGYQIIQSLIAFGSGGYLGVGLGMSRQKFSYLPEAYTDFVFAVVGEELGLLGALFVMGLFAAFGYFGFRIAFRAPDNFGKLLAGGLTGIILVQAAVNIAAVTSLLPVTGVPLPFISAGGTSLVLNMGLAGIILSISRAQKIGVVRERLPANGDKAEARRR